MLKSLSSTSLILRLWEFVFTPSRFISSSHQELETKTLVAKFFEFRLLKSLPSMYVTYVHTVSVKLLTSEAIESCRDIFNGGEKHKNLPRSELVCYFNPFCCYCLWIQMWLNSGLVTARTTARLPRMYLEVHSNVVFIA